MEKIILNYKDFFLIKKIFNEYINLYEKNENSEEGKGKKAARRAEEKKRSGEFFYILLYSKLIITKRGPLFFNFSFCSTINSQCILLHLLHDYIDCTYTNI